MTTSKKNADIHKVLTKRRQVAVIWSIEDVQELRPDLNDKQAWKVLRQCERYYNSASGFSWSLIDLAAASLFPE